MQKVLASSLDLELDLAFEGVSDNCFLESVDPGTAGLLINPDPWQKDIKDWIDFIRKDQSLICPYAVRLSTAVSLGLKMTDDSTIKNLNSFWRHKSEKTDVLSFPILDETFEPPLNECVELGDIVISVATARSQAIERGHALGVELRWLVAHGLLHLLGWDHPNPNSLKKMLRFQEQLLAINVNLQPNLIFEEEIIDAS